MRFMEAPIICRGFVLCIGHISADHTFVVTPEDTMKDGTFSQVNYCIFGKCDLYDSSDNLVDEIVEGDSYDGTEYYGKGYKCVTPENIGGSWFSINPLPATKIYDFEVLGEDDTRTIVGDGIERTIICVTGSMTVNDKTLTEKQYARILNGKTANITIAKGSKAIYFNDSGKKQVN